MSVRVRYAPSPTGLQHIGGVRTALFNYFFARSQGGKFILRIEDTDRERFHEDALVDLYQTLQWLGVEYDEGPEKDGGYGPYIQSERVAMHRQYAQKLIEQGDAYYCYCSAQRLEDLRKEQQSKKGDIGYDRHCRDLTEEQRKEYEAQGTQPVVRFKVPSEGKTSFQDVLLGEVKRKNKDIPVDPVILKSDGYPTYHLANVIDDHFMEITHILRAQEWIPSGALHVLLYKAFGWDVPTYCHLPMVMGPDGQKLSKRHGSTSVKEFRDQGYLPEAVMNYISLLGWAYDDSREFFTKDELEQLFSLEKLNKAPAVFDYKKLAWFNGQYIRQRSEEDLRKLVLPYLREAGLVSDPVTQSEEKVLDGAVPLIRERLKTLQDAPELTRFLFQGVGDYDPQLLIPKKKDADTAVTVLKAADELLKGFEDREDDENEQLFRDKAQELEVKLGDVLLPLRVAMTGSKVSPPLFESIRLIGAEETSRRIQIAIGKLLS
ncbi:MAG: glutamate--tRNA ligase [Spirochaetia bacterium]